MNASEFEVFEPMFDVNASEFDVFEPMFDVIFNEARKYSANNRKFALKADKQSELLDVITTVQIKPGL